MNTEEGGKTGRKKQTLAPVEKERKRDRQNDEEKEMKVNNDHVHMEKWNGRRFALIHHISFFIGLALLLVQKKKQNDHTHKHLKTHA